MFDLIGDLGGVAEVIILCFNFLILPISEHSFILQAAKKLFYARTKDTGLLEKCDEVLCENENHHDIHKSLSKEIKNHRRIVLRPCDSIWLFMFNKFGCLFPSCLWENKGKIS